MTINPVLAQDEVTRELFPLPVGGEAFVLKRDGIDFECELRPGGKLWGRGVFFLSSKRIVFVATGKANRADFKSFEVNLATLDNPKFNQPIFGANYLSGIASPSATSESAFGPTQFSLTFNNGGCGTFLNSFYQLLSEVQANSESQQLTQAAQEGRLNQVAFVDPSDPSVLYLSQPSAAPNSQQATAFDIAAPSAPPASAGLAGGGQQCTIS
eukprot:TRINITY_DN47096_c0_g1_i1.p1 TRINITY_DN47096_c0_g1~~TRINITY_DN47096_c0_g1_i1.p1  ORF type:complete len:212 (-),score=48.15 TRINITY_DN47096_c0_g1_i1:64-699(-)